MLGRCQTPAYANYGRFSPYLFVFSAYFFGVPSAYFRRTIGVLFRLTSFGPEFGLTVTDGAKPPPVGFCVCEGFFALGTVVFCCIRALGIRDLRRILPSSPPDCTEVFCDSSNTCGVGLSVRSFLVIGTGRGTGNGNGTVPPGSTS